MNRKKNIDVVMMVGIQMGLFGQIKFISLPLNLVLNMNLIRRSHMKFYSCQEVSYGLELNLIILIFNRFLFVLQQVIAV